MVPDLVGQRGDWGEPYEEPTATIRNQPDITKVCKQIRTDTLPMYYSNMHIKVRGVEEYLGKQFAWFERIGKANAALLKHIYIYPPYGYDWFEAVPGSKPLKQSDDLFEDIDEALRDVGIKTGEQGAVRYKDTGTFWY